VSLSLVVFWFVRSGLHNDVLALVSGFFTVVGFQTTVGIYAYSVSNWLALIWGFLMFGFILKGSENRSWVYVFVASLFGVALLFTHPYTWNVIMAVLLAYFIWLIVKLLLRCNSSSKFEILRVLSVLIVNAVIYGVYSVLPFGKAVTNGGLGFAGRSVVFPNILGLYEGLRSSVEMWVGGLYANPLLVALAVLGMFWVIAFGSRFNRLTLLWVLVPSLALLVVSPENYMFYRIIYLVPIQVLSSIGVFWAFGIIERKYNLENSKLFWVCKVGILLLIFLVMLNYSLRSVDSAPLHLVD